MPPSSIPVRSERSVCSVNAGSEPQQVVGSTHAQTPARCWSPCSSQLPAPASATASATDCIEEHRALVRTNLRALLKEGINPLSFFDRDYKKVCACLMCVCVFGVCVS